MGRALGAGALVGPRAWLGRMAWRGLGWGILPTSDNTSLPALYRARAAGSAVDRRRVRPPPPTCARAGLCLAATADFRQPSAAATCDALRCSVLHVSCSARALQLGTDFVCDGSNTTCPSTCTGWHARPGCASGYYCDATDTCKVRAARPSTVCQDMFVGGGGRAPPTAPRPPHGGGLIRCDKAPG